jgi:hypothetical protein
MARIKIKDLNVSLEELKKKDPQILKKIRGGGFWMATAQACVGGGGGLPGGSYGLCTTGALCGPGGIGMYHP